MPIPAGVAFAAPLVAGMIGQGANMVSQSNMNRKNREWSEFQTKQANQEAIKNWWMQNDFNVNMWNQQNSYNEGMWNKQNEYNERLWNMQNQYNSPLAQMQRFKEAGLNPNLIYGQSNTGGSIATANLESGKQPTAGSPPNRRPEHTGIANKFDFVNGIMASAQLREMAARTNNLEEYRENIKQDRINKTLAASNIAVQTAKTQFELDMASELKETSIQAAKQNLFRSIVETDLSANRDEREAIMQSSNLREAAQRISNMKGQAYSQQLDNAMKELDLEYKKMGIEKNDPTYWRNFMKIYDKVNNSPGLNEFRKKYQINWDKFLD